jgi:hypothetical protein
MVEVGDLVACYVLNSSLEEEALLQYGIVLDNNKHLKDILVLDNYGERRWWPHNRWRILKKRPGAKC